MLLSFVGVCGRVGREVAELLGEGCFGAVIRATLRRRVASVEGAAGTPWALAQGAVVALKVPASSAASNVTECNVSSRSRCLLRASSRRRYSIRGSLKPQAIRTTTPPR